MVRDLAETGALSGDRGAYRLTRPTAQLGIPPSVEGVLAARIDRLAESEKEVLRTASVIGKEFSEGMLKRACALPEEDVRSALVGLARSELVFEQELFPEPIYAVTHPLTQAVAYREQLVDARRRVHGAVAEALMIGDEVQLDERSALISHHLEGAGNPLEAARWLSRSRTAAMGRGNLGGVMSDAFGSKLQALLDAAPECEAKWELQIDGLVALITAAAMGATGAFDPAADLSRLEQLAERVSNPWRQASVHVARSFILIDHDADRACEEFDRGCAVLRSAPDYPPLPNMLWNLTAGNVKEACEQGGLLRANRERYTTTTLVGFPLELMEQYHGLALAEAGHFAEATAVLDEAEVGYEYSIDVLRFRILQAELTGEIAGVAVLGERAVAGIESFPETAIARDATFEAFAAASLLSRNFEACAQACRAALAVAEARGRNRSIALPLLAHLAEAELGLGHPEIALRTADDAVERLEPVHLRRAEMRAHLARARVLLGTQGASASEAIASDIERALALCERNGTPPWIPILLEESARLHELRGEAELALAERRQALRRYQELRATGHASRLTRELAESPSR